MKSLASHVRSVLQSAPEVGPIEKLRRSSVLFQQKQDASSLFLIETGLIKLIRTSNNGNSFILSVLGAHQLAGVEFLAHAPCCVANAVCLTEVHGYRIPLAAAKRIFGTPEFSDSILTYLLFQDMERITRIEMQSLYEVRAPDTLCSGRPGSDGKTER